MDDFWTEKAPTQSGPYFWRKNETSDKMLMWVTPVCSILMVLIPSSEAFQEEHIEVSQLGGQWQRLVPAPY